MTDSFNSPAASGSSPETEAVKKNALIATIVGFVCGGAIPGVLGLLGYLKADTEIDTARKFTKWAWIAFAIIWGLTILLTILYIIFAVVLVGATAGSSM
ncbi:hypothetical protein [Brachybacterium timonense]|uniref:hypothetical protein n=1 Tax=Brachybacterium timonense TaxID=2050896 RepID=UPI000D0B88B5|nr:hypothetical protein [Brachybacterium timonense]